MISLDERLAVNGRFSPDGRFVAVGYDDGLVRIWRDETGTLLEVLAGRTGQVRSLAYGPHGEYLATAASDGTVRLWNPAAGSCRSVFGDYRSGASRSVEISAAGDLLAYTATGPAIRLRRLSTGEPLPGPPGLGDAVTALRLGPQGARLAWTTGGRLRVGTTDGAETVDLRSPRSRELIAFAPDGRRLVATTESGPLEIWNLAGGTIEGTVGADRRAWDIDFHPAGRILASVQAGSAARLWDTEAYRELFSLEVVGDNDPWTTSFSPDGRSLLVTTPGPRRQEEGGGYGSLKIYDLTYDDRHLAGQVDHQIAVWRDELGAAVREDGPRAWAAAVLRRPWPRFRPAEGAVGALGRP